MAATIDYQDIPQLTSDTQGRLADAFESGNLAETTAAVTYFVTKLGLPGVTTHDDPSSFELDVPADRAHAGHVHTTTKEEARVVRSNARRVHDITTSWNPEFRQGMIRHLLESPQWDSVQSAVALLNTINTGKPIAESKGEMGKAGSYLQWGSSDFVLEQTKNILAGNHIVHNQYQMTDMTGRPIISNAQVQAALEAGAKGFFVAEYPDAHGIAQPKDDIKGLPFIAGLGPTNYPVALQMWELVTAPLAGAGAIVRPATKTPYPAGLLVKAFADSNLDYLPGHERDLGLSANDLEHVARYQAQYVTNRGWEKVAPGYRIVTGKDVGYRMYKARQDAKLKDIYKTKTSLELAGANIVYVDKDLASEQMKALAKMLVKRIWSNSGRVCTRADLLLVHDDVADEFQGYMEEETLAANKKAAETTCNVYDDTCGQGAFFNDAEFDDYQDYRGLVMGYGHIGAQVIGGEHVHTERAGGKFAGPMMAVWGGDSKRVYVDHIRTKNEEIFAPSTNFVRVKNVAEAVKIGNISDLCLADAIYSNNDQTIDTFTRTLKTGGSAQVNRYDKGPSDDAPIGMHGHGANAPAGIIHAGGAGGLASLAMAFETVHQLPVSSRFVSADQVSAFMQSRQIVLQP